MKKLFTAKKYLPVALALAGLAVAGTASAFAQSPTAYGAVLPWHYGGSGVRSTGWNAEAPSVRQLAHGPSSNDSGKNAFAQAPATILQPATQSGFSFHNPATSGYDAGEETQR